LETHNEEAIETSVENSLKIFFNKNKKKNVDDILKEFVNKYPKYKKYSADIYQKICQLKGQHK